MEASYAPDFADCVLPYVQWYQDDFMGGVRGMRAHEIGIYTVLLMEMYARGRPLDMSEERLARLCGADKRTFYKALAMLIEDGKIIRLDSGLWNERCENAFRERAKKRGQQIAAGKTSAEKRSEIKEADERALDDHLAIVQPSSEAQTLKEEPNGSLSETGVSDPAKSKRKRNSYPADFDAAWRAYPTTRNMSKFEALAPWKKLDADERAQVIASIPSYVALLKSKPDLEPLHFCRYLSKRRFEGHVAEHGAGPQADWSKRLAYARTKHQWSRADWGPMPGESGCLVPADLIEPDDGQGWTEWSRRAA